MADDASIIMLTGVGDIMITNMKMITNNAGILVKRMELTDDDNRIYYTVPNVLD
jgi:hypothetical protein